MNRPGIDGGRPDLGEVRQAGQRPAAYAPDEALDGAGLQAQGEPLDRGRLGHWTTRTSVKAAEWRLMKA